MSEKVLIRKKAFEKRRKQETEGPATTYYLDEYIRRLDSSPVCREACATYELYAHIDLPIYPEEGIVGVYCPREPVIFQYGGGTLVLDDRIEQVIRERKLQGSALKKFRQDIAAVRAHAFHGANPAVFSEEEMASIEAHAATSTWFGGHMVLDFETILHKGLDFYQQEIDDARLSNPGHEEFYFAMETMLKAVQLYIHRYAEKAREAAYTPDFEGERFLRISRDLEWVEHHRPQNFRQALQLLWIIHMLNGADSFGRFDSYLLEFYRRDVESGAMTKEEAFDYLGDFFIKIEEVNQIQNMTIGGVDADGSSLYSDLTELCIRVTCLLGYKGPNLCLRVREDMPQNIWDAAMECIGTGIGVPALYNDRIYIDSLAGRGVAQEVANNYCLAGCSQIMIPGQCNFYNDVGILNAAKVFELALYNGFDERTGRQVGPETGRAAELQTYEQFYEAVCRQIDYFCELEISINNRDTLDRASREGYAMRTLFIQDCIRNAKPIFKGGARYNNIELEVLGITNMADSVYAVKKLVYEQGKMSLPELVEVLRNNFEGWEDTRKRLQDIEKFGNDCEELDVLRGELSKRIYGSFNRSPSVLGGVFVPGEVIFVAHDYAGHVTGATPDGRLKGSVLADSAGASQGQDLSGPTALLNSVLKIPVKGHLLTSIVVNMKFLSSLFRENKEKIQRLFQVFFARGGMQLQINVVDMYALEQAMLHPEEYRSLVVRVGGYSDYFVNLPESLQREIMERTAQSV